MDELALFVDGAISERFEGSLERSGYEIFLSSRTSWTEHTGDDLETFVKLAYDILVIWL